MDKDTLLKELDKLHCKKYEDFEEGHIKADELLIKYINDKDIEEAFENVGKWYS